MQIQMNQVYANYSANVRWFGKSGLSHLSYKECAAICRSIPYKYEYIKSVIINNRLDHLEKIIENYDNDIEKFRCAQTNVG